jgi:hypothetical protein
MQDAIHVPPAHPLLDELKRIHNIKYDQGLCVLLGVSGSVISKTRHRKLPVGDMLILAAHEHGGMAVADIRRLAAQ